MKALAKSSKIRPPTARATGKKALFPALSGGEMEAIYRLWDELGAFPAEQTDQALLHLMEFLSKWSGADNVQWFAVVRVNQGAAAKDDPMRGWRLRASRLLVPYGEEYLKLIAWIFERNKYFDDDIHIGMTTRAMVESAGKFRIHRLRDGWVDFDTFRQTEHFHYHYEKQGITDRIWISFPLNADAESMFLLDLHQRRRRFSAQQATLVGTVLRGIRSFQRRLFLDHGLLVGATQLTSLQRRIVRGLLTEMTEKELAVSLGQQPRTMHQYVTALYSRFGVKSRAGLMSLWLGRS